MNLDHTHVFLVAWGNWNNSEYSLLGYASPQYAVDYEAGYRPPPRIAFPESDYERANSAVRRLDATDRAIIHGIYIDDAKAYIEEAFSEDQRLGALRHFHEEFQIVGAAYPLSSRKILPPSSPSSHSTSTSISSKTSAS